MGENRFRTYAAIITLLLFLVAFVPSLLSQAEGTPDRGIGANAGTRTAGSGTIGAATEGKIAIGISGGTIAMGTAIAEVAVIAVATSQSNASNSVTVH